MKTPKAPASARRILQLLGGGALVAALATFLMLGSPAPTVEAAANCGPGYDGCVSECLQDFAEDLTLCQALPTQQQVQQCQLQAAILCDDCLIRCDLRHCAPEV
ncbi:MAG: hypothetical protein MI919_36795 [Holophagales bacterium]|nr:hypothetical protein [Holophagales bacterium]